jgi:ribosome-binding protein aMBF1 (putative translation factor)
MKTKHTAPKRAEKAPSNGVPKRSPSSNELLPQPDEHGMYPAREFVDAVLAQQIIRRRERASWSQAELAKRAGVRLSTLQRLESGKDPPGIPTVDKIDRALQAAGV